MPVEPTSQDYCEDAARQDVQSTQHSAVYIVSPGHGIHRPVLLSLFPFFPF